MSSQKTAVAVRPASVAKEPEQDPYAAWKHPYKRKDRVYIVNNVKLTPHGGPATEKDRRATVTDVTADIIGIRTNNGFETWRLAKNIKFLEEIEAQKIKHKSK